MREIALGKIKKYAGVNGYAKGLDVFQAGKVHDIHITTSEESEYQEVYAHVDGHGGAEYDVQFAVDNASGDVFDTYCECPAFYKYYGACKHCIALMLKYNEAMRKGKGTILETTPLLQKLIRQKAEDKSMYLLQDASLGKVQIEPFLTCDDRGMEVEFKLGIEHMYVMKDVFEFSRLMDGHQSHRYGENLQFMHSIEAFDEASKPIAKFIKNWCKFYMSRYEASYRNYSYSYGDPKSRTILLQGDYIDEYLNLYKGKTFSAQVRGETQTIWKIAEGALQRKMTLTGKKGGVEIKLDEYHGYRTSQSYIYFVNGLVYIQNAEELEPIEEFLMGMGRISDRTAYVKKEDVPAFCRELLPVLKQFYTCRMNGFKEEEYGVEQPELKVYIDSPQEGMITCRAMAKYAAQEYSVFQTEHMESRNIESEIALRNIVSEYGNAYDQQTNSVVAADDEEAVYDLIVYGIPRMQEIAEVYVSDRIQKLEIKESPKVTVGVSISGHLMELKMTAGDMSQSELAEILSKYNRKKKFYRLKDGTVVNIGNAGFDAIAELKNGLQLTDKQFQKNVIQVEKYRALYLDEHLKENPVISTVRDKTFRSLIRNMKTVEDNDYDVPESLQGTLREYQKNGFLWIKTLKGNGFGGILADDMGLGKTLQVITYLLSEYGEASEASESLPSLIVCPASLIYNWNAEIEKFAPKLQTRMIIGDAKQREQLISQINKTDIVITSYDLLRRDLELYEKIHFANQMIDEAQYIKNHNTLAAKAVKTIQSDFRLALTGTPVENQLSELWSIFDYLMPGFLYGYQKFRKEIEIPAVQNQEESAIHRLQTMIRPFVLRRLKKDVLTDLPDKLEENMFAQIEGEQQKLYDAHVQRMKMMLDGQTDEEFNTSKIVVLAELTKLRQLCCDPALLYEDYQGESAKMQLCIDLIKNAVAGGHKILLFSQFTTMLEHLTEQLRQEEISYYMLTGSTGKEKRAQMVEQFNEDNTSVFCISLKAGGTGLNLTAADIVIHYDPWWNVAVQNQASDRAHRIGQKHVVNVYKLIVKNSIEENIVKLQDKKRELADQILSGESMGSGSFTREELLEIIGK